MLKLLLIRDVEYNSDQKDKLKHSQIQLETFFLYLSLTKK